MNTKTDIVAESSRITGRVDLYLRVINYQNNTTSIAQPLTLTVVPDGHLCAPTISIKRQEAQQLMDELWNCGLRPTEGSGSAGSLAATERHLRDMQRLVFGKEEK